MDKTAIKNYAVWARRKLIEYITQKAFEYGITKDKITEAIPVSSDTVQVGGKLLQKAEAKQRQSLVERIQEKGFSEVMEEVAYTWFNRIIAIRFMEVNEYLPTGVRVLSSAEKGKAVPDIVTQALHLDLELDLDKVNAYLDVHNDGDLFRYLFVKQCNKLNDILPYLFEKIEDYTELLLPNNLLIEGSVIRRLVEDISEDDFKEQVEIIGWLYQYYISEKKDEVFEGLKKNIKITKETIPAATQLFTPDWIVKYMVENSLGRLWLEGHPDETLKANWEYYLDEAEQELEVQKQLEEMREKRKTLKPEEIKVLDPCMGSGHILVYAFEVLMEIYKSCGYAERDAAKLILQNNLYGLDIDDRAYQLAYFAVMMKARNYNRRIFNEGISPNLCSIQETNKYGNEVIKHIIEQSSLPIDKEKLKADIEYLFKALKDAKEYGSILDVKSLDYLKIEEILQKIANDTFVDDVRDFLPIIKQANILDGQYDIVVTNPPYMGGNGMNAKLSEFVKKNYPNTKSDMSTVFMERALNMCNPAGMMAMINIPVWMFLSSYEKLRKDLIASKTIINMLHFGRGVFGSDFGTTAFTISNINLHNYKAVYRKLYQKQGAVDSINQKKKWFFDKVGIFIVQKENYLKIPGMPIAYWISERVKNVFEKSTLLNQIGNPKQGLATGDNDKFLRYWFEVNNYKIGLAFCDRNTAKESVLKWFPCNKGGNFRKWFGNNDYIVNWENDGFEIRNFKDEKGKLRSRPQNMDYYFKKGLTWSTLSIGSLSMRFSPTGHLFETKGSIYFLNDEKYLMYVLGLLNSIIANQFLLILCPTVDFHEGPIGRLPFILSEDLKLSIDELVMQNIHISKADWDSFETSWDFKQHPFINKNIMSNPLNIRKDLLNARNSICTCFYTWEYFTDIQFNKLKANEEELNRIFIKIYGLQDELIPEIEEKDVTIRRADLERDIRSFISYAVGCMLGRYSLDVDSLAYAGGNWDSNKYKTFIPDADNVIPITDDEYFNDDIVGRFIEFVRVAFGADTLEENLDFIAKALGNKGDTSREVIRQYFIKDFYKDHVKTYQKKPIYWLFDSGKENGFKALIYMHRYDEFTVAKVRTDYLHRLQKMYEAEYKRCDILIDSNVSEHEKAVARKKKEKLQKQMQECLAYDQVIAHVANQRIKIDLDDGVSVNYAKFQEVEVPQGEGRKPMKADLLAKI